MQCYAAFPCRSSAPMGRYDRGTSVQASTPLIEMADRWPNSSATFNVPRQSVWIAVSPETLAHDVQTYEALDASDAAPDLHWVPAALTDGWDDPTGGGHWECRGRHVRHNASL